MTNSAGADTVMWHDLECGAYAADLPLWRELAATAGGPVLDLGAGTGRVALDLAARGHQITALERDPILAQALAQRAGKLPVTVVVDDARTFKLVKAHGLAVFALQGLNVVGGSAGRTSVFASVAANLIDRGKFAVGVATDFEQFHDVDLHAGIPDMEQIGGTVYSSRPVQVRTWPSGISVVRVRETITGSGERYAIEHEDWLDRLSISALTSEAATFGFRLASIAVLRTPHHFDYTAVVFDRAARGMLSRVDT